MLRVCVNPSDAFFEIRWRGQGSVALSLVCIVLYAFAYTANRVFASFVVNDVDPRGVDALMELSAVLLLAVLFSAGNWSVTCLMDGEGRFRDVLTVTGYALLPAIAGTVLATAVSPFLAGGEGVFYTLILRGATAWTAVLLIAGVMTVHGFTLAKTLGALGLTVLAMFVILFVVMLLANMLGQAAVFVRSVYLELLFRF